MKVNVKMAKKCTGTKKMQGFSPCLVFFLYSAVERMESFYLLTYSIHAILT